MAFTKVTVDVTETLRVFPNDSIFAIVGLFDTNTVNALGIAFKRLMIGVTDTLIAYLTPFVRVKVVDSMMANAIKWNVDSVRTTNTVSVIFAINRLIAFLILTVLVETTESSFTGNLESVLTVVEETAIFLNLLDIALIDTTADSTNETVLFTAF